MRVPAGLLAAVLSLAAFAQERPQVSGAISELGVPKAQLQLLGDIVGRIKDEYAGPVDDTRMASGCATFLREAARAPLRGAGVPVALTSIPRLLEDAKRAAPELTHEQLAHACAKGMAGSLDKHSEFFDPAKFRELQAGSGPMAAFGIEIARQGDAVMVVAPIEGAPAERAGIRAGDRLVSVDGQPLDGLSLEDAVRIMRGRPGTEAKVAVERPGIAERLQFTMKRETIRIRPRVQWLDQGVLLVKFRQMHQAMAEDLVRVLEQTVKERPPAGILLDLRDNSGGLLRTTIEIAGLFLPAETLVGASRGKHGEEFKVPRTAGSSGRAYFDVRPSAALSDVLRTTPMVVLVNGKTASGGEILAAALHGHRRARLAGTPTLGMGSIQTILPLGGNTALKLTTHYWMAPGERKLEGNPLQPDVAIASDNAAKVPDEAVALLAAKEAR